MPEVPCPRLLEVGLGVQVHLVGGICHALGVLAVDLESCTRPGGVLPGE